jgi:hypothetical protein
MRWRRPAEPVAGVLCRGVLNDLVAGADRCAAFGSFASWLRPDGVLLADVRTGRRRPRAAQPSRDTSSRLSGVRRLRFSSETDLDAARHLMRVRERYVGTVDGVAVDESHEFQMRCWTADELRTQVAEGGSAVLDIRPGTEPGLAADRLSVVARR